MGAVGAAPADRDGAGRRVTRVRIAAALGAATLVASVSAWPVPASSAQPAPGQPATGQPPAAQPARRLSLVAQTPFVAAGGEFSLRLRVDRTAVSASAEVVVTVYEAVGTRSEFALNLQDRFFGSPLAASRVEPLSILATDSAGEVRVAVPLQNPAEATDLRRLDLGPSDGVFPVRVALRERGGRTVDAFTTHLVYLPAQHSGFKLGLALVMPFHAPPALPPEGERRVDGAALASAAQALESARTITYTLAPTPETVASAAAVASGDDRAAAAVASLRKVVADHPLVSGAYVAVSPAAMTGAGLGQELSHQLAAGADSLSRDLGANRVDTRTWVGRDPVDSQSLAQLATLGVDRLVVPEAALVTLAQGQLNITLSRPFALSGGGMELPAVAADDGLAAHFTSTADPVLSANHLLADLAVIYLDEPRADRRAVVVMPPRDWRASRAFLDVVVVGLGQSPIVAPVTIDALFADVLPAVTRRGAPLVRELAALGEPTRPGPGAVAADLRAARERLTSFDSVVGSEASTRRALDERLLVAQADEVVEGRTRQDYVRVVQTGIADHLAQIRVPQTRSITLTARKADIPMTFQNRTGLPATVLVEMQSDKLDFPAGSRRQVELARLNTTERFQVVTRTSGVFPLTVLLKAPDGNLVIGEVRLTVRSTATSRLSLAISVSAASFLALWWGRHVLRGRRSRGLVPQ